MINILLPMAGSQQPPPEGEHSFPKPLIEIGTSTIIEYVIENLLTAAKRVKFTFVVSTQDCRKYHLDNTLDIITDGQSNIVRLDRQTKGAACSALMAINHINSEIPLLIANADQVIDGRISDFISAMDDADAGVITFESVHPRWSYARVNIEGWVEETTEKRPISRHAIAGFYYFRRGRDFVESAMRMISKDAHINGVFYIAPAINELILQGKKIKAVPIPMGRYHTFYTTQKIRDYAASLQPSAP